MKKEKREVYLLPTRRREKLSKHFGEKEKTLEKGTYMYLSQTEAAFRILVMTIQTMRPRWFFAWTLFIGATNEDQPTALMKWQKTVDFRRVREKVWLNATP